MTMHIQGRVQIKKDGVTLNSKNGASIKLGGTPRVWVANDQGGGGYQEGETVPCEITCTVLVDQNFKDNDLGGTGLTMEWVADNGVAFVCREAFRTTPGELSNGECPLTYQGLPAVQL